MGTSLSLKCLGAITDNRWEGVLGTRRKPSIWIKRIYKDNACFKVRVLTQDWHIGFLRSMKHYNFVPHFVYMGMSCVYHYFFLHKVFLSFLNLFLIGWWLLYNVVLVSAIHQHESVIGIHLTPHLEPPSHLPHQVFISLMRFFFLFYYSVLQDIEYSSLCYTVGPCCLSTLYRVVCTC